MKQVHTGLKRFRGAQCDGVGPQVESHAVPPVEHLQPAHLSDLVVRNGVAALRNFAQADTCVSIQRQGADVLAVEVSFSDPLATSCKMHAGHACPHLYFSPISIKCEDQTPGKIMPGKMHRGTYS